MSESLNQNLIFLFWVLRSNKSLTNFSRAYKTKYFEKLDRTDMKNPKFDLATEDIFQTWVHALVLCLDKGVSNWNTFCTAILFLVRGKRRDEII